MDTMSSPAEAAPSLAAMKAKKRRNTSNVSQGTLEARRVRHKVTEQSRRSRITTAVKGMRELLGLDPKEEQARVLELAYIRLQSLAERPEASSSHVPLDDDGTPPAKQAALVTAKPTHASRTSAIVTQPTLNANVPSLAKASTMSPLDLLAATAMQCQSPETKATALSPDAQDEHSDAAATSPSDL
eukprot:m.66570 g.66570  ORF g.66570 m.66570 type:complete len:186 (-) comp14063_c0_seq1:753-1310(-)